MELLDEPDRVMPGSNLFIAAIWKVYQKGYRMTKGFMELIWYPAKVLTRRYKDITTWKQAVKEEATRIPTFYGANIGPTSSFRGQRFIALLFFIIFAVVHFAAAYISIFPTFHEAFVWIWSALVIFIAPCGLVIVYKTKLLRKQMVTAKDGIPLVLPYMLGIFVFARIAIFVLGFTTLRGLPPEAVNTIHWPKCILIFIGN